MDSLKRSKDTEAAPVSLNVIKSYSTLFAEWIIKENDIVMHLFPRLGSDDLWTDGHYINRCRRCDKERPDMSKPCECGHKGLRFVPGRQEEATSAKFPEDMFARITASLDKCWAGSAAVESTKTLFKHTDSELSPPPEKDLGAWVIQFQGAWSGNEKATCDLIDKFLDALDASLDTK